MINKLYCIFIQMYWKSLANDENTTLLIKKEDSLVSIYK